MSFFYKTPWILACLLGASSLSLPRSLEAQELQSLDWREELREINEEIKNAEDLRDRYLAAARRAEDQGMRWQFMQDQKQEAKRAFERADEKKKAAKMLEARIKTLKARRDQILQEHSEVNDFPRSS
jgi:DNA repair exonuclease SbcCD ATPase subunit